jgi:hypothetical protein
MDVMMMVLFNRAARDFVVAATTPPLAGHALDPRPLAGDDYGPLGDGQYATGLSVLADAAFAVAVANLPEGVATLRDYLAGLPRAEIDPANDFAAEAS